MSKLHIEVLTPPTPYQIYLEERLQSARGLGWEMPTRAKAARQPAAEHPAPTKFAGAAFAKPA